MEIQDDPMWMPMEMVANRRDITKRELLGVLTQAFENVKLGGSDDERGTSDLQGERFTRHHSAGRAHERAGGTYKADDC